MFVLGVGIIDLVPFFFVLSSLPGLLHSRRKLAAESHFINTAAMNQGVDDARQTLKYTKARMREIIARIEANQEGHGQPSDTQVSTV
jgi:hypothetical protein